MLDISSLISDAIETCGVDIEELIEYAVRDQLDDICNRECIKEMIKDQVKYTVYSKVDNLTDKVRDGIAEYMEVAVDEYIN